MSLINLKTYTINYEKTIVLLSRENAVKMIELLTL